MINYSSSQMSVQDSKYSTGINNELNLRLEMYININ